MQIQNKFDNRCAKCGTAVKAGDGVAQKPDGGRWLTYCLTHAPEQIVARKVITERSLTARGEVIMPYEAGNLPLIQSMPGARWDKATKIWTVSLDEGDRARVLEIADKLGLNVAPEVRVVSPFRRALPDTLYPFQRQGVEWLALRNNAILADQMGCGKTPQALLAIEPTDRALVVCPAALKYNWERECQTWRSDLRPRVVNSIDGALPIPKPGDVVIINYDILPKWLLKDRADMPTAVERLSGITLVCDECFPYETLIETDKGLIAIGSIVENKMEVKALSRDLDTGEVSYRDIVRFIRKTTKENLVTIKHETGEFSCTGNHKIWTENRGYVRAEDLQSDDYLCVLREYSRSQEERGWDGENLLSEVHHFTPVLGSEGKSEVERTEKTACAEDMRALSKGVCVGFQREIIRGEEVLWTSLRGTFSNVTSGELEASDRKYVRSGKWGSFSSQDWSVSTHEGKQSDERSRCGCSGLRETPGEDVPGPRGEREINLTSDNSLRSPGEVVDGVSYIYLRSSRGVYISSELLQGGYSQSRSEIGYRSGREDASNEEVEVSRQPENQHLELSRVVRVEIYESESDGGSSGDNTRNRVVYDLEVEGNHNYFAEGVLVSNCHFLSNYKTQRSKKVNALREHFARKTIFLTGTPLDGNPGHLATILKSAGVFRDAFGSWTRYLKLFNAYKNRWGGIEWGQPDPIVPELLRLVMLRRTRQEVLPDLPSKTFTDLVVNGISATLKSELDAIWDQDGELLEVEQGLPDFKDFSRIRAELAKAKIPALLELVEQHEEQGVPLVVGSDHVAPLEVLAARPGWAAIKGGVAHEERQRIVEAFTNGTLKGVALQTIAGGVGLNLQVAWKMIQVDLSFNPASNNQLYDRLCRIGQTSKKIEIARLVINHPLEKHIHGILTRKINLIEAAVERMINAEKKEAPSAPINPLQTETADEYQARLAEVARLEAEADARRVEEVEREKVTRAKGRVGAILERERARKPRVERPLTPGRIQSIRDGIRALAGVCDGAIARDNMGFNKPDSNLGHLLSIAGLQDENELRAAEYILLRYPRQVTLSD